MRQLRVSPLHGPVLYARPHLACVNTSGTAPTSVHQADTSDQSAASITPDHFCANGSLPGAVGPEVLISLAQSREHVKKLASKCTECRPDVAAGLGGDFQHSELTSDPCPLGTHTPPSAAPHSPFKKSSCMNCRPNVRQTFRDNLFLSGSLSVSCVDRSASLQLLGFVFASLPFRGRKRPGELHTHSRS